MSAVELESSRTYPVAVEAAFDRVLSTPLPEVFSSRYAAMPRVRSIRHQHGEWGTVGQMRTVELADGGTLLETLTAVDRPRSFDYRLSDITGPMKPLVIEVAGKWRFDPVGTGVRITWAWTVHPRGSLGRAAMPAFGRMWQGYARRALEQIEHVLLP
jgi:hypothetical protein